MEINLLSFLYLAQVINIKNESTLTITFKTFIMLFVILSKSATRSITSDWLMGRVTPTGKVMIAFPPSSEATDPFGKTTFLIPLSLTIPSNVSIIGLDEFIIFK